MPRGGDAGTRDHHRHRAQARPAEPLDDDHRRHRVRRAGQPGRAGRGRARVDALGHLAEEALAARVRIGRDVRREDERRRPGRRAIRRGQHAVVRDAVTVVVVDVLDDRPPARVRAVEPVEERRVRRSAAALRCSASSADVAAYSLTRIAQLATAGRRGRARRRTRAPARTPTRARRRRAPGSIASTGAR